MSQKLKNEGVFTKEFILALVLVFGLSLLSLMTGAYSITENPGGWKCFL